jgi:hypothetical protein
VDAIIAAVVSAITSVIVALGSFQLAARQQRRGTAVAERYRINATYLNPLRLQLVDNHYRLWDILRREKARNRLLAIEQPADICVKDSGWFNDDGNYLASSAYLMACMFAHLKKVREDIPYLQIQSSDDTRLAELILRVQVSLVKQGGIQYVNQISTGEDMWSRAEDRLLTYREFCGMLRDPESRIWLDRVLMFYLDTARGERNDRANGVISAMQDLVSFLDRCVGGGEAIASRWVAEGIT